jgi:hypothetical protein
MQILEVNKAMAGLLKNADARKAILPANLADLLSQGFVKRRGVTSWRHSMRGHSMRAGTGSLTRPVTRHTSTTCILMISPMMGINSISACCILSV